MAIRVRVGKKGVIVPGLKGEMDVGELRKAMEEHRKRISYARQAKFGDLVDVSLESQRDDK